MLAAWALFHAGEFQKACEAGLKSGGAGITVANKSQAIYANYLEKSEKTRLAMFLEVSERAEPQQAEDPKNPNAYYWEAYALGRYSQGISIAKALKQGIAGKVRISLESALERAPKHAEAHTALALYHAEIIGKIGAMIGGLTYGAKASDAESHIKTALKLTPDSPIAHVEPHRQRSICPCPTTPYPSCRHFHVDRPSAPLISVMNYPIARRAAALLRRSAAVLHDSFSCFWERIAANPPL